jgi:seryl-tRNA synthetase
MSEKISDNVNTIEKEIGKITKLTNFKKIMTKHNSIKKKIKTLNDKLDNIEEELKIINDIEVITPPIKTEEEFNINLNMLKTLKHKFEESEDIEEQLHIYKLSQEHIIKCKKYLESQTMDIIEEK